MRYLDVFGGSRLPRPTLWSDFDRVLSHFVDTEEAEWSVPVEVSESENAYFVSFDVPGVNKDDIKIEVHGRTLTVSGERKRETTEEGRTSVIRSRSYGQFSRSFTLPDTTDNPKIEAKYAEGVLEVVIPKAEASKPRQIEVR